MRRGFTWTELLVIVAVLLAVAALATPVFLHAREAAGRAKCLSNLRTVSAATQVYATSNASTMPLSMPADAARWYSDRDATVPAVKDMDRCFWANAVGLDLKDLDCPVVRGIPFNYNGYLHGVPIRRIQRPSDTIAVWEGRGKSGGAQSSPRLDCGSTASPCGYFHESPTIAETPAQSVWTHGRGANFLLLDGHAKWRRLGQKVGIPTNSNHDPFRVYDKSGHVDSFWLDENNRAILFKLD